MSGLVDIWTEEVAKLREKGQAVFSAGSTARTSEEAAHVDERTGGGSFWWQTGLAAQVLRVKELPSLKWSEASVSMLVDIFSA
ncbi:hypothetical protein CDL12_19135 [Handroanthus impetiginosus]|uniref:Uncharacterized protein n=1 Tax=Handroanthus impetiginosus TaxID=429701 RepID=A0A2G9GST8_9LAMI|nr:hypothetical protein CDL12_19135 [Handroanthus impetiginosus]